MASISAKRDEVARTSPDLQLGEDHAILPGLLYPSSWYAIDRAGGDDPVERPRLVGPARSAIGDGKVRLDTLRYRMRRAEANSEAGRWIIGQALCAGGDMVLMHRA